MNTHNPLVPLPRSKKLGYAAIVVIIEVTALILFGGMEGRVSAWQLLRVVCIAGIPVCAVLAFIAWSSDGKRSDAGITSANVKVPVRFLKALPYLVGII